MLQTYPQDYLHRDSVGTADACDQIVKNTAPKLRQLFKAREITTYQLSVIKDINDVRFIIFEGNGYDEITQGRYPFVFCLLQPIKDDGSKLDEMMDQLQFTRLHVTEESSKRLKVEVRKQLELIKAANAGDAEMVEELLEAGLFVEIKDDRQRTPLHCAAEKGNVEVARLLLKAGADLNASTHQDIRPIHVATIEGHIDVVRTLVEAGAKVDVQTSNSGETPLHIAAQAGDHDVVEILLKAGASIDVKDPDGRTPLQAATEQNYDEVVQLFRKNGS